MNQVIPDDQLTDRQLALLNGARLGLIQQTLADLLSAIKFGSSPKPFFPPIMPEDFIPLFGPAQGASCNPPDLGPSSKKMTFTNHGNPITHED